MKDLLRDSSESRIPPVTTLTDVKRKLLQSYINGGIPASPSPLSIAAVPCNEPAPLSLSQEQLLLREINTPGIPPLYNECINLQIRGDLDITALDRSFAEVIRRHEIWRTSYVMRDGRLVQIVHTPPHLVRIPVINLESIQKEEQEEEIRKVVGELIEQPFDLITGPFLRAVLIRMRQFEHRLYLVAHLSIVDGISVYQVFPYELAALYSSYCSDQPSTLRDLSIQFGNYTRWQRQWWQGKEVAQQLEYWKTQLAGGLPALNWPNDRKRPPKETFRGEIRTFALPKPLVDAVKALSVAEGATMFVIFLAAFASLLHSYTQQDDFVIGTPSPAGRKRSEVQRMLGYFLTPVALRFRLTSGLTFRELLKKAQRTTLEAISNDDVPVELLACELNLKIDPSRNPLFTVALSLQPGMVPLDLDWSVTSMDISSGGAPWDLYLAFIDKQDEIAGRAQYNPDLFEPETITRMLHDYQHLLEIVCTTPEKHVSEMRFS